MAEPASEPWSPWEVHARLRAVTAPWYIAAGWALDLFRGEQTREHGDTEIGLPNTAEAFSQVRDALADCEFEAAGSGLLWPADSPALAVTHQTWVSEPGPAGPDGRPERVYRLDVFREPQRDGRWVWVRRINVRHDPSFASDRQLGHEVTDDVTGRILETARALVVCHPKTAR
ncbi:MAG: nucleotidyltransferase domain-containing protein [Streptosporangiaceae bacterium]